MALCHYVYVDDLNYRRLTMTTQTFTASIFYRAEKPYGVGKTAHERHSRIEPGFRAEVINGLPEKLHIYTGVCSTREECKRELVDQLKKQGLSGTLRFV